MNRTRLLLAVAAATVLVAAACTTPGPGLDGETFTGDQATGFDLVPGTEVSVHFSGEEVRASAGCNTLFGHLEWSDERMVVGELASTEMGCDPLLHEQDEWLAQVLTTRPTVDLEEDTLTLTSSAGSLQLTRVRDADLEGTTWRLEGLEKAEAVSSVPAGVEASLRIRDGHAQVDFGCNTGSGSVHVSGSTLRFENLIATLMGCDEDAMEVEDHISAVLNASPRFEISGDRLHLRGRELGLYFVAD